MRTALSVAAIILSGIAAYSQPAAQTGRLGVDIDPATGVIDILFEGIPVLADCAILVHSQQRTFDTRGKVGTRPGGLTVDCGHSQVILELDDASLRLNVRVVSTLPGAQAEVVGARVLMGPQPIVGFATDEREGDRRVLTTTLGTVAPRSARTIFDRERDLALTFGSSVEITGAGGGATGFLVRAEAPVNEVLLSLQARPDYYREELGVEHYAPIRKRSYFQTAPCVAMTWYGLPGWDGRPAQTKERLYQEIEWVGRNLGPFSKDLVFQLDDNYPKHDDDYMRDISDEIRRWGLVPGIWFTPYVVAPQEAHADHPEWFLHDAEGNPIPTFGGISYNGFTIDTTDEGAVEAWYRPWWRKMSETWNFDFFKIDGQPDVVNAYRRAAEGRGIEGYRRGLDIGREVVGDAKFINACWGTPVEAIGKVDGSRTGGDTGDFAHAIDVVIRWNYLNNVSWWSDPDAAANLYKATVERARLNTQARTLTGQQFLTDDKWTQTPDEIAHVWQRGIPNADILPANIYPIDDWRAYDLIDLKVGRPFGTWDVVGVMNYEPSPRAMRVDLSRLDLAPGTYHVYDAWGRGYLGQYESDAALPLRMAPSEGKLLTLHPDEGRPQILGTSRHITQGGLDLQDVSVERARGGWDIHGRSSRLVHRDHYVITMLAGAYDVVEAASTIGPARVSVRGEIAEVDITPLRSGDADWTIRLRERKRPLLGVRTTEIDLGALEFGAEARTTLDVINLGVGELEWQAKGDADWLELTDWYGTLTETAREASLGISVDTYGLDADTEYSADIAIAPTGSMRQPPCVVRIVFRTALPPNLAPKAEARASSEWPGDYGAAMVNDGQADTRWNSGPGDVAGAWIELEWRLTVGFDRVTIDEVIDWGYRVQAWRLEARQNGRWQAIARGSRLGPGATIDVPHTRADGLRVTIDEAADVPTIAEISVYDRTSR